MIVEVMKVWRCAAFQMGVLECRVEVWTAFEAIKDKKQCLPCKSHTFHKFNFPPFSSLSCPQETCMTK